MTVALARLDNAGPAAGMDFMTLGKMFAASGFFQDAREAAQALVKIQAGAELGFPPVASMTGVYIVKGKVSLSANMIAAAIKRSGKYTYRVLRLDDDACELEFFEGGQSLGKSTFTVADARRQGTQNVDRFPRNMLFARALSNGAKWHTPDVFGGPVYTPDELGAAVDDDGQPVQKIEARQLPPAADAHEPSPEEPSVQAGDADDVLADDNKFVALLDEAFQSGEFTAADQNIVRAKVFKKHGVKSYTDLPLDKRHALLASVVNHELDKLKLAAPVGA